MRRFVIAISCLAAVGCSLLDKLKKHEDSGAPAASASADEAASAAPSQDDGGAPAAAPAAPANEKDVKRFPDEEQVVTEPVPIEWPSVVARTQPAVGAVVATLGKGTKAAMLAKKGRSALVTFPDPKDASRTLMGWVPDDAFVAGTAPPPVVVHTDGGAPKASGVCGAGLTLLFDADAFCGKTCKTDKDCAAGQTCSGHAKPLGPGGLGDAVAVCAKAKTPTTGTKPGAAADAGAKPGAAADAGAKPGASGSAAPSASARPGVRVGRPNQ